MVTSPQSDAEFLVLALVLISYLILGALSQVPLIFILTTSRGSYSPYPHFINENMKARREALRVAHSAVLEPGSSQDRWFRNTHGLPVTPARSS